MLYNILYKCSIALSLSDMMQDWAQYAWQSWGKQHPVSSVCMIKHWLPSILLPMFKMKAVVYFDLMFEFKSEENPYCHVMEFYQIGLESECIVS